MTIVHNVIPVEFDAIKSASQPFIILKTEIEPTAADKLLIFEVTEALPAVKDAAGSITEFGKPSRHTGNELPLMQVTCVRSAGLVKNHYAVGFHLPDMAAAVLREPAGVKNLSQQGEPG